ncbi:hypothetical protein H3N56_02960 [Cetobacterium sp. 2A]|nr:hypothetical protein [Cetobacterium sp. 2A]MBC2855454.1 hypothetical protein [Cetobacterium sp. 2A]
MGMYKNILNSMNSSIKDSINNIWKYFNELPLKDKVLYIDNMIDFF